MDPFKILIGAVIMYLAIWGAVAKMSVMMCERHGVKCHITAAAHNGSV